MTRTGTGKRNSNNNKNKTMLSYAKHYRNIKKLASEMEQGETMDDYRHGQ
jgi:hypothetical protein